MEAVLPAVKAIGRGRRQLQPAAITMAASRDERKGERK